MKLNWGHKILAFYLVFVAGIMFLVVKSNNQKVDLVTADYYSEELRYQERIEESGRAAALSSPLLCSISHGLLTITFPTEFKERKISGEVLLYCPADEKKDIRQTLDVAGNLIKVELPEINKGAHIVMVKWKAEGSAYYFEKNIFIQ
jgi:hypothetical protein